MSQAAKQIVTIILGVLLLAAVGFSFVTIQEKEKINKEKISLSKQIDDYRTREKNQLIENKNLQDQLASVKKEKDDLTAKIANVGGDLDEMGNKIKGLTTERDDLKKRFDAIQTERDQLAQKLTEKGKSSPDAGNQQAAAGEGTTSDVTRPTSGDDEDYWAKVLKDKAALQMELDKTKDDLSKSALEISDLKKQNSDLDLEISKLKKDKEAIAREIKYGNDLAKNLSIELARAQNEKQFMSERMEKINDENNNLHQQLKNLTSTKIALEKSIVQLQGDKKQVEGKLMENEGVIQTRIDQIYQLKDSLEKDFKPASKNPKTGDIDLSPIIVKSGNAAVNEVKAPAALKGNIISVNEDNNFVIVNLGEDSGISIGDKLNVYHGADYIAGLEVIQVRKDISAADIKNKMTKIQVGDSVR